MLECQIGCLGLQRGRLPWATQQMTVKKSIPNRFCSA